VAGDVQKAAHGLMLRSTGVAGRWLALTSRAADAGC